MNAANHFHQFAEATHAPGPVLSRYVGWILWRLAFFYAFLGFIADLVVLLAVTACLRSPRAHSTQELLWEKRKVSEQTPQRILEQQLMAF